MKKLFFALCLTTIFSAPVFAIDLAAAKASGLIGEGNMGYLEYVVKPPRPEVVELVKSVNQKRRDKFATSARRNGIATAQVARRFYERAVSATKTGHYYQAPTGKWVKK